MSNPKSNKFRVGDKVKVVSHNNTVKRFGRDSDDLANLRTRETMKTMKKIVHVAWLS